MACCPCSGTGNPCSCNYQFPACVQAVSGFTATFSGFGMAGGVDFSPVNGTHTFCYAGTTFGTTPIGVSVYGNEPTDDTIQVQFQNTTGTPQTILYSIARSSWNCCSGAIMLSLLSGPAGGTYPSSITITPNGSCNCGICNGLPSTLHWTPTIQTGTGCGCCNSVSQASIAATFGAGPNADGIARYWPYSWVAILNLDVCASGQRMMAELSNTDGHITYTFYNTSDPGTTSVVQADGNVGYLTCGPFSATSAGSRLTDEFGTPLCPGNCGLFTGTWTL